MKLTSKYTPGDVVYRITRGHSVWRERRCDFCAGTGEVTVAGTARSITCPDCSYGTVGGTVYIDPQIEPLTIGQVRVESQSKTDRGSKAVTYMCKETGIGSGTVHSERSLFATWDDADAARKAEETQA